MKHVRTFCLFLLFTCLNGVGFSQITSMGFTQRVVTPSYLSHSYYPKLKILGDTLFVCSNTGIYYKDLLHDSDWELYAFKGKSIIEFIKNGSQLLALSTGASNASDSLLLFSPDKGKTYVDYTSDHFREYGQNYLQRIAQNPENFNSCVILNIAGISQSCDFGKNWSYLNDQTIGQQVNFISFHPIDTTTVFFCGETDILSGRIYKTSDYGTTWSYYEIPGGDNCVHQIDFHPLNPDTLIFGGEGVIGKSTDKGETWELKNFRTTGMYFYKVIFDKDNPNTLYASGARSDNKDTVFVYRSTDTGDNWELAYKEYLGENGGDLIDMVKYKDNLILYSRELGVLTLNVKTIPTGIRQNRVTPAEIRVYLNPVQGTLCFETGLKVQGIEITTPAGNMVKKAVFKGNTNQIDVSGLETGVYLIVFDAGDQRITKKVCIK